MCIKDTFVLVLELKLHNKTLFSKISGQNLICILKSTYYIFFLNSVVYLEKTKMEAND